MRHLWVTWLALLACCKAAPSSVAPPSSAAAVRLVFVVDVMRASNEPRATMKATWRAMERRIEGMRLAREWSVRLAGPRLAVALKDVPDIARAKRLLTVPARLGFQIIDDEDDFVGRLRVKLPPGVSRRTETLSGPAGARTMSYLAAAGKEALAHVAGGLRKRLAPDRQLALGEIDGPAGAEPAWRTYTLVQRWEKVAAGIRVAQVRVEEPLGRVFLSVELDDAGARWFERLTADNLQKRLAIVVDGEVRSAPVIRERIAGGRLQITLGGARSLAATLQDANELVLLLRAGALLAPVRLEEEGLVGGPPGLR